uniref:Uncharacterized protein n=1 Tax=Timema poppense TaxID=170557 RepID=A0A7R9D1M3_TIMPO|nr:unnamed protein product [Timema poppensis]
MRLQKVQASVEYPASLVALMGIPTTLQFIESQCRYGSVLIRLAIGWLNFPPIFGHWFLLANPLDDVVCLGIGSGTLSRRCGGVLLLQDILLPDDRRFNDHRSDTGLGGYGGTSVHTDVSNALKSWKQWKCQGSSCTKKR